MKYVVEIPLHEAGVTQAEEVADYLTGIATRLRKDPGIMMNPFDFLQKPGNLVDYVKCGLVIRSEPEDGQ